MPMIEFTEAEIKQIGRLIGTYDYGINAAILTKLKAVMPEPTVRCYHCREIQATEDGYAEHLDNVHHYGDSREDGAEATAWKAFHTRRV